MYNEGMKLIVFTSDLKTVLVILMNESLTREPPKSLFFHRVALALKRVMHLQNYDGYRARLDFINVV